MLIFFSSFFFITMGIVSEIAHPWLLLGSRARYRVRGILVMFIAVLQSGLRLFCYNRPVFPCPSRWPYRGRT